MANSLIGMCVPYDPLSEPDRHHQHQYNSVHEAEKLWQRKHRAYKLPEEGAQANTVSAVPGAKNSWDK